jgi:hypothetical protein
MDMEPIVQLILAFGLFLAHQNLELEVALTMLMVSTLQTKEFEVDDTALQIPLCGDQLLKVQCSFDSFFCVLINFDCLVLLSA